MLGEGSEDGAEDPEDVEVVTSGQPDGLLDTGTLGYIIDRGYPRLKSSLAEISGMLKSRIPARNNICRQITFISKQLYHTTNIFCN